MAALLAEHGAATLDYDGHQDFLAGVIAAVEREAPAARGLLLASSDERGVGERVDVAARERLVLREQPGAAVATSPMCCGGSPGRGADPRSGASGCTSSPRRVETSRLRAAVRGGRRGSAWLGDRGYVLVVTVRSAAEDGDSVDLPSWTSRGSCPGWCGRCRAADGARRHFLACLGDLAWRDHWSRALRRTRVTGLVDLSPMAQLSAWRAERSRLRYAQATVRDVGDSPAELLVWQVGDTDLPLLWSARRSRDILRQYIERTYPDALAILALLRGRDRAGDESPGGRGALLRTGRVPELAVTDLRGAR